MKEPYILSIDQSTQGPKCLLFDCRGSLLHRTDAAHQQIVSPEGWISHNMEEIYRNLISCIRKLVTESGIDKDAVRCIGISNQRETTVAWNRETGKPICSAIVWQCSRSRSVCERIASGGHAALIQERTGLPLSPYFPASKMAWILEHNEEAKMLAAQKKLYLGTVDSWLIYRMTNNTCFRTDYSNASRTQLFNIRTQTYDKDLCSIFGVESSMLPKICDSDSLFGMTDLGGFFNHPIPIHSVLGDSQSALFGQGCLEPGMIKATYGTGSSVVINIGSEPKFSSQGIATSVAWRFKGRTQYIMEGNINYTGAVLTWLTELGLLSSAAESSELARQSNPEDSTYLVPAFTGLGAPYWDSDAKALFTGMSRKTGRAELVRAGLECIAFQIRDVLDCIKKETDLSIRNLFVDGGPTQNEYLMQFQSDLMNAAVQVPKTQELSGIGAAYMSGIAVGIYDESIFHMIHRTSYHPQMSPSLREKKYEGWQNAIKIVLEKQ